MWGTRKGEHWGPAALDSQSCPRSLALLPSLVNSISITVHMALLRFLL